MRKSWKHLEKWRTQNKPYTSPPGSTYGAFQIAHNGTHLMAIATDGIAAKDEDTGWEHVSVRAIDPFFHKDKTPTWEQMAYVKSLFWESDECVVEFHPPKSEYVNTHANVLHLWRYTAGLFPMPNKLYV